MKLRNSPRRLLAIFLLFVVVGAVLGGAWRYFMRPGLEEYRAHRYPDVQASGPALRATWFGVSAVLLNDGEHAVFVDPFFTRPRYWWRLVTNREIAPDEELIARWLRKAGVRDLDAVLVSHSHYDHSMDSAVVARLTGATLVGSQSTANIGRGGGLPERSLRVAEPGKPMMFGPWRITFVQGRHAGATGGRPTGDIEQPLVPPARYLDYKQGGTFSILIEHPMGRVLHHGSAGFVNGALEGKRADVVFLGVALMPDLADYLSAVVDPVGASRVIPVHWDDFTRPLDEPLRHSIVGVDLPAFFERMAGQRPGLRVMTLEAGEPVVLFPARLLDD